MHGENVQSLAFSPDGRLAFSHSSEGMVKLWELATGKELRSLDAPGRGLLAFSPDRRFALSSAGNYELGELNLWDVTTGKELRRFTGHTGSVTSVAFSADGSFALSAIAPSRLAVHHEL